MPSKVGFGDLAIGALGHEPLTVDPWRCHYYLLKSGRPRVPAALALDYPYTRAHRSKTCPRQHDYPACQA